MKNQAKVIIVGGVNEGKTTITELIHKALEAAGIECTVVDEHYPINTPLDDRIGYLKDKLAVSIETASINRNQTGFRYKDQFLNFDGDGND